MIESQFVNEASSRPIALCPTFTALPTLGAGRDLRSEGESAKSDYVDHRVSKNVRFSPQFGNPRRDEFSNFALGAVPGG